MFVVVLLVALVASAYGRPEQISLYEDESYMHPHRRTERSTNSIPIREEENDQSFWNNQAQQTISQKLLQKQNTNAAKNVIMFLGDGMSVPTLKAARIYMGQLDNESGEESSLSFEKFPYVGLSKTYCIDRQVPDSACTATAYLCGVKANEGTIGVSGNVLRDDCEASLLEENHVSSIGKWSQAKNKRTGIVTTTRVTHASPAGVYAHTSERDWESDADKSRDGCQDIAMQLVHGETGKNFNVILGGGRREFLPNTVTDEEGSRGRRLEGNMLEDWLEYKKDEKAQYVWNRTALLDVPEDTDYLLGLFESSHCNYHLDATDLDPSLEEMTEAAIKILSKGENGYFLFVEGGRIDQAHHDNKAHKALDETVEFSKAIQKAYDLTDEEDTLIVVTSDHSHVMTVNGYPDRGNDILGVAATGSDGVPTATLSYANGPGYRKDVDGVRFDVTTQNMQDKNFLSPALAPLSSETHGGDEVGIFASGPWSQLFTGMVEQNVIAHAMAFASCVGDGLTVCDQKIRKKKTL